MCESFKVTNSFVNGCSLKPTTDRQTDGQTHTHTHTHTHLYAERTMSIPLTGSVDVSVGEVKRRTADDDSVVVSASIQACSLTTHKLVMPFVKRTPNHAYDTLLNHFLDPTPPMSHISRPPSKITSHSHIPPCDATDSIPNTESEVKILPNIIRIIRSAGTNWKKF